MRYVRAHVGTALLVIGSTAGFGTASEKVFTNEDLAKPAEDAAAVTNEDLAGARGNLTFTEPGDDVSYENSLPVERKTKDARVRENAVATIKKRYKALRARQEALEAELPEARDAAERELGPGVIYINGIPTAVGPITSVATPAHDRLDKLERELEDVRGELRAAELEARQYGLGRPGLMQR